MAVQYACKDWTDTTSVTLTAEQLKAVHAALCDAVNVARDRQLEWLNVHENPRMSPEQRADAWAQFKAWEGKETACVETLNAVRATGVELNHTEFGWR